MFSLFIIAYDLFSLFSGEQCGLAWKLFKKKESKFQDVYRSVLGNARGSAKSSLDDVIRIVTNKNNNNNSYLIPCLVFKDEFGVSSAVFDFHITD